MDFTQVVKNKKKKKKYSSKPVPDEAIKAILETGRLAPTAKNLQEQHIYLLRSGESLAKMDSLTPCRYNAPAVLMVAYDKEKVYTYPGGRYTSGAEDAAIVATHLILAAYNEGVDSCWVNNYDPDKAAEIFGLPENEAVLCFIDLGYAADGAGPLPNHFSRKELTETVTEI